MSSYSICLDSENVNSRTENKLTCSFKLTIIKLLLFTGIIQGEALKILIMAAAVVGGISENKSAKCKHVPVEY